MLPNTNITLGNLAVLTDFTGRLHNLEGAFGGHVEAGKEGERDEGERYKVSWNKVSFGILDSI